MLIDEGKLRQIIREELGSGDRAIVYLSKYSDRGVPGQEPTYVIAYDITALERCLRDEEVTYNGVIAGVYMKPTDGDDGPCNGTWHIGSAGSNEKGWGTRVYLAAFDLVKRLSPDRWGVSASAEATWKSLARRFKLDMEPFDDNFNPKTPPPGDDCKVFRRRDPAINASYHLTGEIPADVQSLIKRGEEHFHELDERDKLTTAKHLLRYGYSVMFRHRYDG